MISFVLGSGVGGGEMNVPDLVGMTLNEARTYLSTISVNIGSIVAMETIRDSASAFVVKQTPQPLTDSLSTGGTRVPNHIRQGQVMDIYISGTPPVKDTTFHTP